MSRTSARWWLAMAFAGLMGVSGFTLGVLVTPTAQQETYLEVGCHPWENGWEDGP